MAWVVDTCIIIDVAEGDPDFGFASAALLERRRSDGLKVCPVTYVELAPVFDGNDVAQREFLFNLGVTWPEPWTLVDTQESYKAWHRYIATRRILRLPKRPLADILIGAFASRFGGMLTRNQSDFRGLFPSLPIETP